MKIKKKYITKEKHYDILFHTEKKFGLNHLGIMTSYGWDSDPKRLTFVLSRYKFVSKMLAGKKNVLEIGACDGWPSRLVKNEVKKLTVSDFDKTFVEYGKKKNYSKKFPMEFMVHDMSIKPTKVKYDGIYALDVIEHIHPKKENKFIRNIKKSLLKNGSLIIGCPSLESQKYSPGYKKKGHINCKSASNLKTTFKKYFHNVFVFSMNDEVLHTGFYKMSQYLFLLCTNPK